MISPDDAPRPVAAPFLRWPGGKQWLTDVLPRLLPPVFGTYFEPFVGGGSIFFASAPSRAALGDINPRLIETFSAVRDKPLRVLYWLRRWPNSPQMYRSIRGSSFAQAPKRAAQFIYLNKTCWNGLYRVNRRGDFNVPYCHDPSRSTHDPVAIRRASPLLAAATLRCCDFEDLLTEACEGDFVYLDPPYTVLHANNGFRRYNQELFSWDDQRRLASLAARLASSGCYVVVSNALNSDIRSLYRSFKCHSLSRLSRLSADPRFRRAVNEALLVSHNIPYSQLSRTT